MPPCPRTWVSLSLSMSPTPGGSTLVPSCCRFLSTTDQVRANLESGERSLAYITAPILGAPVNPSACSGLTQSSATRGGPRPSTPQPPFSGVYYLVGMSSHNARHPQLRASLGLQRPLAPFLSHLIPRTTKETGMRGRGEEGERVAGILTSSKT